MTLRDVLRAAALSALLLLVMAAAGLAALRASVAGADHDAIRAALAAADPRELGVPDTKRRIRGFDAGYFPECAGVAILTREDRWPEPLVAAIRADTVLPDARNEICPEVQAELHGRESGGWFTYARYWHGALILHRLVLSHGDYADLQRAVGVLVVLGLAALFGAVGWRVGVAPALALTACIALLSDAPLGGALPIQATGFAALLLAVAGFAACGAGRSGAAALVAAAASGAALNFFDFLYTPAAFAMLNAWVWLAASRRDARPRGASGGLWVFAASLAGYGAFWALKWAAAFALDPHGDEVFIFGAGEFARWGPATGGTAPLEAIAAVTAQTFDAGWKLAAAAGLAALTAGLAVLQRAPEHGPMRNLALLLLPLAPAALVIELMAAHTLAHTSFTFRIVPMALGLIAASVLRSRYTAPDARTAAISAAP